MKKKNKFKLNNVQFMEYYQGLFLADFIAVIGLYSLCKKVSFFPNFWRKIPNFKSEKKIRKIIIFIMVKVGLKLSNIQIIKYII